jgi:hypothetical protein
MKKNRTWTWIILSLSLTWAGVAAVMRVTDHMVSTPEKLLLLLSGVPWLENPNLRPDIRAPYLEEIIRSQNLLSFDQRRSLREEHEAEILSFLDSLSEEEQHRYVDGTVEQFLLKVLKILDSMKPEDRRGISARIRRETGRINAAAKPADRKEDDNRERKDDELDDLFGIGLEMHYRQSSPREKLAMAQMLENLQGFLQGQRR